MSRQAAWHTTDSGCNCNIPWPGFKQINQVSHFSIDLFSRKPKRIYVLNTQAELLLFKTVPLLVTQLLSESNRELIFILLISERKGLSQLQD